VQIFKYVIFPLQACTCQFVRVAGDGQTLMGMIPSIIVRMENEGLRLTESLQAVASGSWMAVACVALGLGERRGSFKGPLNIDA
jgi:hypothetical protein